MNTKIILLAYPDPAGLGELTVITKNAEAVFYAAKERHEFPAGIQRLEFFALEHPGDIADYLGEDVANHVQNTFQSALKFQETKAAEADAQRDGQKYYTAAHKIFQAAATRRNAALGALASPQNALRAEGLAEKEKKPLLEKIEKLQPAADAAVAEFNGVLEQFNIIRNPKATKAAVTAALIALKVIKAPEPAALSPAGPEPVNEFKIKAEAELNKSTLDELRGLVAGLNKGLPITNTAAGFTITPRQQLQQFQETTTDKMIIAAILANCDFTAAQPI